MPAASRAPIVCAAKGSPGLGQSRSVGGDTLRAGCHRERSDAIQDEAYGKALLDCRVAGAPRNDTSQNGSRAKPCRQIVSKNLVSARALLSVLALLIALLPAKAGEEPEAALQALVLDYLRAAVAKDSRWLAEQASEESLRPYEALRLAALHARPEDLLVPPRDNPCYQEPTVVLVLILRATSSAETLGAMDERDVFQLLSPFLFPRLYPVSESDARSLLSELDDDPHALLASSILVQVSEDEGHVTLKHDAAMSSLSLFLPSRLSAFTDEVIKQDAASFPRPLADPPERLFARKDEAGRWRLNLSRILKMNHYYAIRREDYWEMDGDAFGERVERDLAYSLGDANFEELLKPLQTMDAGSERPCPYQDLSG